MTRADVVRGLAASLRDEANVSLAVAAWLERFRRVPGFAPTARRIRSGRDAATVVAELTGALGPEALALAALLRTAQRTGCPASPAVDALAAAMDRRDEERSAGTAAATAARNSARAMVLMPAVAAPILLVAGVPLGGAVGMGSATVAATLMYAALRWIERLIPVPSADDAAVRLCETLACALAGGLGPGLACAEIAPLFGRVTQRPARLVRLGLPWPDALARSDDPVVRRAGELLVRMARRGSPAASELLMLARDRRESRRRAFDVAVKAAPVRMIWPLVVCSLPAFCALVVVPLVRGIASSL